jgi:hypothetical protein
VKSASSLSQPPKRFATRFFFGCVNAKKKS